MNQKVSVKISLVIVIIITLGIVAYFIVGKSESVNQGQNSVSVGDSDSLSSVKKDLSISTNSNLQGSIGTSFSAIFKPVGGKGPYVWDGELTAFLIDHKAFMQFRTIKCDNTDCFELYGTPTTKTNVKSFPFQVILKDSKGEQVIKSFTFTVK